MAKRKPVYRLQIAVRSVAEIEVRGCESLEEALAVVGSAEASKAFFKEHPVLTEEWEEVDGNTHVLGVYEMEPGWSIIEK